MFFLLRMAFWLGLVCVLLPGNGSKSPPMDAQINTVQAVTAASAAVSDMRGFCARQPDACEVGGKVAVALGHKAQAGAKTIYDFITAQMNEQQQPAAGSMDSKTVPVSANRGTLTLRDLAPVWHAPVPLPPRREARYSGPTA